MKVCIAGKNNIAVECLYYVLKFVNKKDIFIILNRTDTSKNTWQKSLGFYAAKEGIEVTSLDKIQNIEDLLFLSLEFDRIINPELFTSKNLYNIHFSLLPEYKGMYTSLLPILHGRSFSGVTLHKIDKGIDTGEIVAQTRIQISSLTAEKLYDLYLKEGTSLVCKNFHSLLEKNVVVRKQSPLKSSYYSKTSINFEDQEINPFQTAFQIQQFVKAFNFRVYQLPKFHGTEIYSTHILEESSQLKPGSIIEDNEERIIISTIDYNIILFKDYYNRLLKSCEINDLETAEKVLKFIPDINTRDRNGWNPLIIAAYSGSTEVVDLLLKNGADPNGANLNGTTVLMYAKDSFLKTRDFSILEMLLNVGADISAKDIYDKTVFDYTTDQDFIQFLTSKTNL